MSVHMVRDYVLRGSVHPARRTESGYGIFDGPPWRGCASCARAFEAGIGLNELVRLRHALIAAPPTSEDT